MVVCPIRTVPRVVTEPKALRGPLSGRTAIEGDGPINAIESNKPKNCFPFTYVSPLAEGTRRPTAQKISCHPKYIKLPKTRKGKFPFSNSRNLLDDWGKTLSGNAF